MLNPDVLTDAIVAALRTISPLVTLMAGDASRIYAHHYLLGVESSLELAVETMVSPSVLVAFRVAQPGNFDGSTIYKYGFEIYVKAANVAGETSPVSYGGLWVLMFNSPVNGGAQNIRSINLVFGADIMDTPGLMPAIDAERMDYFVFHCVIPEIGDN